ncbi:MAG TPA: RNA 3'-terminal phosphate cyclase [Sedimentisphaerales bacterium]|nr:RNA 3'-terminal phosphate cyclase [Sedimentisphaerales bacterium]
METVFIDGSTGEGGGQILRTSLTLACVAGKSLHIENIRAARRNPGLARQHLSCVQAACQISNGQCRGAALGSGVLDFQPGPVQGGNFSFDIGSAGSASLVIQTVLPALFLADGPSTVIVTGGTHNPMAPPFDFLRETFLPAIANAGFEGDCKLIKHGFYPAGGGKITFDVKPWEKGKGRIIDLCGLSGPAEGGFDIVQGFALAQIYARIYIAKLPSHIAQRQQKLLLQSGLNIQDVEHIEVTDSDGPGNCVMIRLCIGGRTTVFTAFGMRGKPSQEVVGEVVKLAKDFLASGAAVDRFLADQLLIYMAMSSHFVKDNKMGARSKTGCYTTNELSSHLQTNLEIIKKFLPVDFVAEEQKKVYKISCQSH